MSSRCASFRGPPTQTTGRPAASCRGPWRFAAWKTKHVCFVPRPCFWPVLARLSAGMACCWARVASRPATPSACGCVAASALVNHHATVMGRAPTVDDIARANVPLAGFPPSPGLLLPPGPQVRRSLRLRLRLRRPRLPAPRPPHPPPRRRTTDEAMTYWGGATPHTAQQVGRGGWVGVVLVVWYGLQVGAGGWPPVGMAQRSTLHSPAQQGASHCHTMPLPPAVRLALVRARPFF